MSALGTKQDASNVALTVDQLISAQVTNNFYEFGKIIPLVNDVSSMAIKGMNQIKFPCLDEFQHEAQTFPLTTPGPLGGPEAITCQSLVLSEDILDIDKKCVMAVSYDPCDLYQSVLNWENIYQQKVVQTLVRGVELELIAQLATVDAPNALTAATAGTLTEGDLLCLVEALHKKNIPEQDRVFLVNPADWKLMMSLTCFLKTNESGSDQALRQGQIGSVFGSPVIWDNAVPAGTILYFHRDHVRFARQGDLSILSADVPKKGCKEMSWTVKYGFTSMKDGCRGASLTI